MAKQKITPPTLEEVRNFYIEKGFDPDGPSGAEKAIEYYTADGPEWTDKDGKLVKSWKKKLLAVTFKFAHKLHNNSSTQRPLSRVENLLQAVSNAKNINDAGN